MKARGKILNYYSVPGSGYKELHYWNIFMDVFEEIKKGKPGDNQTIYLPSGIYPVEKPIVVPELKEGVVIMGDGPGKTFIRHNPLPGSGTHVLSFGETSWSHTGGVKATRNSISNLTIDSFLIGSSQQDKTSIGMFVVGQSAFSARNCHIWGDQCGVFVLMCRECVYWNCVVSAPKNNLSPVFVIGSGVHQFYDSTLRGGHYGFLSMGGNNVLMRGCDIRDCGTNGICCLYRNNSLIVRCSVFENIGDAAIFHFHWKSGAIGGSDFPDDIIIEDSRFGMQTKSPTTKIAQAIQILFANGRIERCDFNLDTYTKILSCTFPDPPGKETAIVMDLPEDISTKYKTYVDDKFNKIRILDTTPVNSYTAPK
jgi:hypothetical protein